MIIALIGKIVLILMSFVFIAAGLANFHGKAFIFTKESLRNVKDFKKYGIASGKVVIGTGIVWLLGSVLLLFGDNMVDIGLKIIGYGSILSMIAMYCVQKKYNGGILFF